VDSIDRSNDVNSAETKCFWINCN